ncbi:MAG TPA: enolase C-terminal domain-like protein [Paludibaculum sp.]|jgi:L-alanine-DL-glutamate epimerase-like enolase superfamily enzyme
MMKVRGVRAYLMSDTAAGLDAMLIMVEGEDGLCGYAPGRATEAARTAVETWIAPFLEGRALRDPDALRILFHQQAGITREVSRVYDAVEMALYDLTARTYGVALCDLLGGPVRDEVSLYTLTPGGDPEATVEAARRMREMEGREEAVMLDGSGWWGAAEHAIHRAARALKSSQVTWVQDPYPPGDHDGWSRLEALGEVPLAGGRFETEGTGLDDLIARRCVDVLQCDLVMQGGFHTGRPLLASVARSGLRFAFVSGGTALDAVVAAHLAVCWPEDVVPYLEGPRSGALSEGILAEDLSVHEGVLELDTSRPGLGIDINLDAIQRFPWVS